jgi:hypothetical protein
VPYIKVRRSKSFLMTTSLSLPVIGAATAVLQTWASDAAPILVSPRQPLLHFEPAGTQHA